MRSELTVADHGRCRDRYETGAENVTVFQLDIAGKSVDVVFHPLRTIRGLFDVACSRCEKRQRHTHTRRIRTSGRSKEELAHPPESRHHRLSQKKKTILLYFCIHIDFLKRFSSSLVSCSTFCLLWSVPSMKKKKQKHFEQLPWRNYWSYAFKHSCSFFSFFFFSFYCKNSCCVRQRKKRREKN